MKEVLIICRGIPGSGKTSIANLLASGDSSPVYSADDYFYENGPNPGKYDFNRDKLHVAHGLCLSRTEGSMKEKMSKVFVANTFTTEKEIKPYKELADKHCYMFVSLIVENRHSSMGIHNVPSETINAMVNRFTVKLK